MTDCVTSPDWPTIANCSRSATPMYLQDSSSMPVECYQPLSYLLPQCLPFIQQPSTPSQPSQPQQQPTPDTQVSPEASFSCISGQVNIGGKCINVLPYVLGGTALLVLLMIAIARR